jgi:RasGEF domain
MCVQCTWYTCLCERYRNSINVDDCIIICKELIASFITVFNWIPPFFFPLEQIKHTIAKLQAVVCSDGRFRVMREALHRCDPPCIPYLGMYLTDLSFIEEGTPDFTPERLLNFSKMRMVSWTNGN